MGQLFVQIQITSTTRLLLLRYFEIKDENLNFERLHNSFKFCFIFYFLKHLYNFSLFLDAL